MANRFFRNQFRFSMEKDVKEIFAQVNFGATGAPTLVTANSKGIRSIVRNSAGNYTIIMGNPSSTQAATTDVYKKLLQANKTNICASAPAAPMMYIVTNTIATTGTLIIQFANSSGTATDPATGESALLQFVMGDSNV